MTEFERDVIERLVRVEDRVICVEKSLKGFKTKMVTVASALGAFVASIISYFVGAK